MKKYKVFPMILAALALTACSGKEKASEQKAEENLSLIHI